MIIKSEGTYLAMCDRYTMIFRAVGTYPFFKVVNALILNDFIRGGDVRMVKENEVEIQNLIHYPDRFAIASLDAITDSACFKDIDIESTGVVDIEPIELRERFIEKLKYIEMPFSGVHINSLLLDLSTECGMSLPQGRLAICGLRKIIKNERNKSDNANILG